MWRSITTATTAMAAMTAATAVKMSFLEMGFGEEDLGSERDETLAGTEDEVVVVVVSGVGGGGGEG